MNLIDEYRWRGMLHDATEGADEALQAAPRSAYIGFDPTASSLHVGSLMPIMGLVHLQRAGHTPVALVGGGTGLIGDPSGKAEERQLLTKEQAGENAEGIRRQLAHFLDFEDRANPARMENNLDWLAPLPMIDFLRDTGKHFSVNAMLKKESVRRRLESDEEGITYTEFSYMLLQAYDFLALYDRCGCTVQMGGSDQWGNITAGIDLIRRMRGARAWGIVFPLVTGTGGVKFGKTEAGSVWLDSELTSPYRFYQFWLNVDDRDVVRYLKYFTLLDRSEIGELEAALEAAPHERAAQRALAEDVTRRLHGEDGLSRARHATEALFGGDVRALSVEELEDVFEDVPKSDPVEMEWVSRATIVDLLSSSGVASSRGDARRSIEGGGIYLNGQRVIDVDRRLSEGDVLHGRFIHVRRGKKRHFLVPVRTTGGT